MSHLRVVKEATASILQHTQATGRKEKYVVMLQLTQMKKRPMSYSHCLYARLDSK